MTSDDIEFLERLAKRVANALYYGTQGPIGTDGSVSPGLLHDDYDRLRRIAREARKEALRIELAALEAMA